MQLQHKRTLAPERGSVLVSDKYIQLVNYCKAYEVQLLLVPDFVLGTHEKLS
ncbi:hypothetical protein [Pedobacter sp. SYSU D00535]|uniref:hypothetical protein n=1 Tax=Pedobacter sp. SYSU D00535 TaxID=2810308 RepID=UPI001A95867A|nr:hypothetical protein [Pedobacter sp. SYSU D00535]